MIENRFKIIQEQLLIIRNQDKGCWYGEIYRRLEIQVYPKSCHIMVEFRENLFLPSHHTFENNLTSFVIFDEFHPQNLTKKNSSDK